MKLDSCDLKAAAPALRKGDRVLLSGYVYTARDAAHKKIFELLKNGEALPFKIGGAAIYYAGPTEKPDNLSIGSCGPTTSSRMDRFTPALLDNGLTAMIGKGERNAAVQDAIRRNKAVYFAAIGGAGALAAVCVESFEVVAFAELGCESVKKLRFVDFPLIVAVDCAGGNIYEREFKQSY